MSAPKRYVDVAKAFTFREEDGRYSAVVDHASTGVLTIGTYPTEGGAVDRLHDWCEQRGVVMTAADFTIRQEVPGE